MTPAAVLLSALGLAGWAGGCPGRAPAPAAAACAPVEGALAPGARADALAGTFRLTLVATRGPRAGDNASGTLRLLPFGTRPPPVPPAPGARYPLYGGTDVAVAALGALAPGDVAGADASRPGVLVLEWARPDAPAGTREITLRLGADANQGDRLRFDGEYMALAVREISSEGFRGSWESGGGEPVAGGYFCAVRDGARS